MVAKGKKLENDVKRYLKSKDILHHKLHDSHSARGIVSPVPSDFILFPQEGNSVLLECKETMKANLPLTAFRPSQLKAMRASLTRGSVEYYAVVSYNGGYRLLHAEDIIETLDKKEKSLCLEDGSYYPFDKLSKVFDFLLKEVKALS